MTKLLILLLVWLGVQIGPPLHTITMDRPVLAGSGVVSGRAAPGAEVNMGVVSKPFVEPRVVADNEGYFLFSVQLEAQDIIWIEANGHTVEFAVVMDSKRMFLTFVGSAQ